MRKTGSCFGGRALLNKALIQLSADEWDCAPALVVFWPEVTQPSELGLSPMGSVVRLMASSKRVYSKGVLPRVVLPVPLSRWRAPAGRPMPPEETLQL